MKTKISKMLALTVLAFVVIIITSSGKGKAAENGITASGSKEVKHIYKIVVMGNVDVYLSQGPEETLRVDGNNPGKIQWEKGVLRISSFEKEKMAVSITVSNLSTIEASGDARVRTMNELSAIGLDIQLRDHASAQIEAKAVNIYASLEDASNLQLSGESINQHLGLSGSAYYEASRFTAENRSMTMSDGAIASINQQGAVKSLQSFPGVSARANVSIIGL